MIKSVQLKNFKGIKNAQIEIIDKITGIYGENGVGKTSVLEAIKLFQLDYCFSGDSEKNLNNYLKKGEDTFGYKVEIEINKMKIEFSRYYNFNENIYIGYTEEVRYKLLENGERLKKLYTKNQEQSVASQLTYKLHGKVIKNDIEQLKNEEYECLKSHRSDFFDIPKERYNNISNGEKIYNTILQVFDYIKNIQLIDLKSQAISSLGVVLPLHHHIESSDYISHGIMPLRCYDEYYTESEFNGMKKILNEISRILEVITDGKKVIVERYKERLSASNELEISIAIYVEEEDKRIPIEYESTGIVKLISILSSITSLITTENSFVLIDELDAHVFEYLLSIIVDSLKGRIKGTLIFTSHNLTLFESLSKENILVASKNQDNNVEFNRFKNISQTTNIRDVYIRLQNYGDKQDIQKSQVDRERIQYLFEDIELGL